MSSFFYYSEIKLTIILSFFLKQTTDTSALEKNKHVKDNKLHTY